MHWSLAPVIVCALACAQTSELAPELLTLARIKVKMAETLDRQPNYTCIQQVERSRRRLPKHKFELHDLLRIEVALVGGKEMYAWPGSRKFEDTDLTDMVSGGAIGTGNFATHARAIFLTPAPRFQYIGPEPVHGRPAIRYNYVVPLLSSGYHIRVAGREAVVGFHGSLWADPETHELIRLEVVADDIPPVLGIAAAQDAMEYGRTKIGASEFLLPTGSELSMVDLQGNESRNRTQFMECRQFSGESVLTFAEAPEDESRAVPLAGPDTPKQAVKLPGGLVFEVRLQTEIDSARAAVGDPVTATLDENIKEKHRILFAKGARLLGRIARLERHDGFTTLDLHFSEMESADARAGFSATVDETSQMPVLGPPSISSDRRIRITPAGGLHFRGTRFRLRPGHRLRLRTQNPRRVEGLPPAIQ